MGRKRLRDNTFQVGGMQGQQAAGPREPSHLVQCLLQNYYSGEVSAAAIQEICACALKDGTQHPDVEKLSRIGSSGYNLGMLLETWTSASTHLFYKTVW